MRETVSNQRCRILTLSLFFLLIPWALYIIHHPELSLNIKDSAVAYVRDLDFIFIKSRNQSVADNFKAPRGSIVLQFWSNNPQRQRGNNGLEEDAATIINTTNGDNKRKRLPKYEKAGVWKTPRKKAIARPLTPVLGSKPVNGSVPLFGIQHKGGDAVFALACKYPKLFYKRFVGSLRKASFTGDIVLAVSPPDSMKPGVKEYLKKNYVVAYAFDVKCAGVDNCKLQDDFLGYPDPRPTRPFANIRYALYEYWLRHYEDKSYILILDFRDTFFQLNPFSTFGPIETREPKYELHLFAENHKVKTIGKCVFNSLWIGRCFGRPVTDELKDNPVICSGSTLGSYSAISHYVRTMLTSMDKVQCWKRGIESDQGYQNYLYYHGRFNVPGAGNATAHKQGDGVVNTIGAMNGFRVPKDQKGPLDTFWKIRDADGFILNNDGTRSACVHQWDRFYSEMHSFIDTKMF